MKSSILFFIFVLATGGFVYGQKPEYKIRVKTGVVSVSDQGKWRQLNLLDEADAAKITDARLLFAARRADITYLVIDVSGQSKLKQDNRMCGAGVEANLIWLKLDADWNKLDSKSARYESCWSTATSNDGYRTKDNQLFIEIDDFHNDLTIKLSYDGDQPEKGFQITRETLKEPR